MHLNRSKRPTSKFLPRKGGASQAFVSMSAAVMLIGTPDASVARHGGVNINASAGRQIRNGEPVMSAPVRAADFLATIGLNVHLEYTDGLYANTTQVLSDLQYLGIRLVRDATPNAAGGQPFRDQVNAINTLATAGVRFDFFVSTLNLSSEMAQIDAVASGHPGAVIAVEGENEINNFNLGPYDGQTGEAAAKAYQHDLYAAVHADPTLAGVTVYYLTGGSQIDLSTTPGLADVENGHPYPNNGEQPGARISSSFPQTYLNSGALPQVVTETGYFDNPANPAGSGVSDPVQAIGDVEILLDGARQGLTATYLYQLLTAYPDSGSNTDAEYGLFNYDGSAKPVATAIHDLTTILADTGAAAANFTPTLAKTSETGLPSTALTLALEKSNGTQELALWNEAPFWNPTTQTQITIAPSTVTVQLGATYGSVSVFDPILGATAIKTYTDVSSLQVALAGDPLIVQFGGTGTGSTGGPGATVTGGTGTLTQNADGSYDFTGNGSIVTAPAGATHVSLVSGNQMVQAHGTDTITGGSGADTIDATGHSLVEFGHGSLLFLNGGQASTVDGGYGSVTMNGGYGGGVLRAGAGGNSVLYGGDGNVAMYAVGAGDRLYGSAGNDTLTGGAERCALVAETGAATLIGGSGLTIMKAGMQAGAGPDLFAAGAASTAVAQVSGFVIGRDHVEQSSLGAGYTVANTAAGTVFTLADGASLTLLNIHASAASLLGS